MNRLGLCLIFSVVAATVVVARPEPHRRPAPRPPVVHRPAPKPPKPPKSHWRVDIAPWGSALQVSQRVGKNGRVSLTVPVVSTPVVREEKTTIIVQQQPVIVQQVEKPSEGVELNPVYAKESSSQTRTWVEGYWKVTRTPDGRETDRVWVPGYWEE